MTDLLKAFLTKTNFFENIKLGYKKKKKKKKKKYKKKLINSEKRGIFLNLY